MRTAVRVPPTAVIALLENLAAPLAVVLSNQEENERMIRLMYAQMRHIRRMVDMPPDASVGEIRRQLALLVEEER